MYEYQFAIHPNSPVTVSQLIALPFYTTGII